MGQLKIQLNLSLTSNFDSAVWGVRTEGIHLEKAVGVFYVHRWAKMEVTMVENNFCTKELPL